MFGVYGFSVWQQDPELHSFSKAMISAHALSALTTVAIKGITNTDRPTTEFHDGHYGFPSYHTSSTFAIAATIEEYYGWKAGLPAYTLAGLVGWSRIDQREHDLSDVLFGAVLGYTIGKSVAAAHLERDFGMNVYPYYEPTSRTSGIMLDFRF
ncbi:MAG: phosphatase PAP2 family protein [Planctomycetales bacterium]|nr:phosphatase PAP2 family protein [Planctomycetales bacterium]